MIGQKYFKNIKKLDEDQEVCKAHKGIVHHNIFPKNYLVAIQQPVGFKHNMKNDGWKRNFRARMLLANTESSFFNYTLINEVLDCCLTKGDRKKVGTPKYAK